ncbi:MAG: O-antigen ligase family protein [Ferruginibacter sp.]
MLKDQVKDMGLAFAKWLRKEVFYRKLVTPLGLALLVLVALASGYLAAQGLFFIPLALGVALIGATIVYVCIFNPMQGFFLTTVIAFFIFYPGHLVGKDLPIASSVDLLIAFLFLGSMLSKKSRDVKPGNLFLTPVSIILMLNVMMFLLEGFNPYVPNISGWTTPVRRLLVLVMVYVVAYRMIDRFWKFKKFIKLWILLGTLAGLYAIYQQYFGYLPGEMRYIMSQPGVFNLLFQGGQLRKFSFFADVVTFGIFSGSMGVVTLILGINEPNARKRNILLVITVILMLGMAYSGTRTTNIILPAGIALYGFITIQNKKTLVALFGCFLLFMFVLFAPIYSNPTLNRIRTTFDSKEESLNVREVNRHFIQPYLHHHPYGAGVSTTGVEGTIFYPGHPLAGFPPDSGLLKIGLEMGWIGLLLHILLNSIILYQGIYYYFRMRNKELKKFMVMILCGLFPYMVCQFSQNAIGQLPSALWVYSCMALIKRLKEFDEEGIILDEEKTVEKRHFTLWFK